MSKKMTKHEFSLSVISNILMMHQGENNAVSAKYIASILGVTDEDTHATIRKWIKESAIQYSIPVIANHKGFYMATSTKEMQNYINTLNKRIKKIEEMRDFIQMFC